MCEGMFLLRASVFSKSYMLAELIAPAYHSDASDEEYDKFMYGLVEFDLGQVVG